MAALDTKVLVPDCIHIGLTTHARKGPLLTLDERAARVEGAALLAA